MEIGVLIALLAVIAGLIGTIAVLLPKATRNQAATETVQMQQAQLDLLRNEIHDSALKHDRELAKLRSEVEHLQGQMAVMRSDFAAQIAAEIAKQVGGK